MTRLLSIFEHLRAPLLWLLITLFVLVGLVHPASAQAAPVLTFTLETSSPDGLTVVPRLTWQTTPAAQSCTASGASDWTGSKAAAGTVLLAAVNASRAYGLSCTWPGVTVVALAWVPPTNNTDGSALTNLGGYRIAYGTNASALDKTAFVQDPAAKGWTSPALAPGNWSFTVRAFNTLGLESQPSNTASKTTSASANQSRTVGLTITFPNPPTGVTAE